MIWLLSHLVLKRPLILFSIICCLVHREIDWVYFLLLAIVVENFTSHVGIANQTIKINKSLLERISILKNKGILDNLEKVSQSFLAEMVSKRGLMEINSRYGFLKMIKDKSKKEFLERLERLNRPIDGEVVKLYFNSQKTNSITSTYTAYSNFVSTSHIILNQNPNDLTETQKFFILHEMGHTTYQNVSQYTHKFSLKFSFVITLVTISIQTGLSWTLIFVIILLPIFFLRAYDRTLIYIESSADIWALNQIKDLECVRKIVEAFKIIFEKTSERHSIFHFNIKGMGEEEILNSFDEMLGAQQYLLRIKSMERYLMSRSKGKIRESPIDIVFELHDFLLYLGLIIVSFYINQPNFYIFLITIPISFIWVLISYQKLTSLEKNYNFSDIRYIFG